jgi:hypothetical protein
MVTGPATPSRASPAAISNTVTACIVDGPYRPSRAPSQFLAMIVYLELYVALRR